jgi:beta-glucuronidase
LTSLNGAWRFAFEPAGQAADAWREGVPGARLAAVPGAWNEQVLGGLEQVNAGWYERRFDAPEARPGRRFVLRFDAASLVADVWLDGEPVGRHEGGFLPFAFDVTDRLRPGEEHRLVVRVEHGLSTLRTPVGGRPGAGNFGGFPTTSYDFFPMGGLIRPVRLLELPEAAISGVRVETVDDAFQITVETPAGFTGELRASLRDGSGRTETARAEGGRATLRLQPAEPRLWSPADPHLQAIQLDLVDGGAVVDTYVQSAGLRTVAVQPDAVLINGERVFLKGFGKHEDFPVSGRGLNEAVVVRDAELMRWVGANSYRTSHYPYAEEALELADRTGLLVISETSAVGLNFYDDPEHERARLGWVSAELEALVERDRNHPSVIAWSVANEPFAKGLFGSAAPAPESVARGVAFLGALCDQVRRLDPSRPVMVVGAQGHPEEFVNLGDIITINRYYGWYSETARLEDGAKKLGAELDGLHQRYGKPIIVAEFGADTLPGVHSADAEMWSEEFQVRMLELYLDQIERRPFVCGAHVWNFADFKTGQGILRAAGLNHKGVFTRDRRPKMAAHALRRRWSDA